MRIAWMIVKETAKFFWLIIEESTGENLRLATGRFPKAVAKFVWAIAKLMKEKKI